jgi:hydrogenase maturation protein HypF
VTAAPDVAVRCRYRVSGVVQGVGFRPFVYVTATALGLSGSVANDAYGVVVDVEGERAAVTELGRRLRADAPPLAVVAEVSAVELAPTGDRGFRIAPSERAADPGVRTQASPDVATCADCLRELADPADRRYRHPFITCTNCGPRWTIIRELPYDRPATTMAGFAMCGACAAEYADPADRRFHAQPIGCHDCGPRLELVRPERAAVLREQALAGARALLAAGAVVAVKGLGGYHLACDARDEEAVGRLRARKRRGDKPFAVLVADLAAARRLAGVDASEAALLTSPRRPVVLLDRTGRPDGLAPSVAPGSPDLGVLLPYTPLHVLLLEPGGPDCLVLTSGNLGGEPIAYRDDDALVRLAPLVDAWLRHDRPIQVPVDDSVTRVVDGREAPVRRSRGYAPLAVTLPVPVRPTLAVGADLKNTCAVGAGERAWLSQHIGDVDDLATLDTLAACAGQLERLIGVAPRQLAADAHPAYRSAAWARRTAAGREVRPVQHHHAHIAAVMAEHQVGERDRVIGVAFDGTGYGSDGAVWGGEVLVAGYRDFARAAHLAYVPLAGGDLAVRRPYRMALAHLRAAGLPWDADLPPVLACPAPERGVLAHQLDTGLGVVPTSSMGRLFDAVSSLLGVRHTAGYEAQAAIELEAAARGVSGAGAADRFAVTVGSAGSAGSAGTLVADAAPVVRALVGHLRAGTPVPVLAAAFHEAVVALVLELATRIRAGTGLDLVCLGGGVFGNALLHGQVRRSLRGNGFRVLSAEQVPANDGGIALGQLMVSNQLDGPVERRT